MNTTPKKLQAGVPPGGTAGQALVKNTGTDFDYDWISIAGGGSGGVKLFIDPATSSTNSQVFVDLYREVIPGGTLSDDNAIYFEIPVSSLAMGASGDSLIIKLVYGTTEIIPEFDLSVVGDGSDSPARIRGILYANAATGAQKAILTVEYESGDSSNEVFQAFGTAAEDSTIDQDLAIVVRFDDVGCNIDAEGIIAWKIADSVIGGSNTVVATAGNTFTAATTSKPVSFGDDNQDMFVEWGGSGAPTFQNNVGNNAANEKLCLTFSVDTNDVVLIDTLQTWVDAVIGSPTDFRLSIQETTAGDPNGVILGFVVLTPINAPSYQGGALATPLELTGGTYAFVVDRTGAVDGANYWSIGTENLGGVNVAPFLYNTGVWTTSIRQPKTRMYMTYAHDSVYLSAQTTGNRMQSIIINSGGGVPYVDVVPAILNTCSGWVLADYSIGDSASVAISGAVSGLGSYPLNPISEYICDRSDGHIISGSVGTLVGRALLTDTMLIIPA